MSDERDPSRDLWETHAEWWIDGFTAGADPEYEEQILPLAEAELAGARPGARHRVRRRSDQPAARAAGGATVVGIDPTWNQISVAHQRGGGAALRPSRRRRLPFADASFDAVVACLVFEHIDAVDEAIAEVARVLQPGGRFCFFLNHPLLQTPGQRLDRRPDPRPARAVLADRAVPRRRPRRSRRSRWVCSSGSSTARSSRYVNTLAEHGLRARADGRAGAAAGLPRPSAASTPTRPRSRGCCISALRTDVARRVVAMAEIVLITGLSGAGRSGAAAVLEDLGLYVVDNLPTSLMPTRSSSWRRSPGGIERLALVSGRQHDDVLPHVAHMRASGHHGARCCSSTRRRPCSCSATTPRAASTRSPTRPAGLLEAIELERELLRAGARSRPTS